MKLLTCEEYPKEIKVGRHKYKLQFVAKMPKEGKDCDGLCDLTNRVIYIKESLSYTEVFNTLVHEVLHAVAEEYNIKLTHKAVYQLEAALSDLILTNF